MDDFVVEHIFIRLQMDMFVLWRLHWINKSWFKVLGRTSTWQALEIVKFNNASYCHIIVIQGLSKFFLKTQLNFELEYLQYCIMADDSWNSLNDTKSWHLYMTFHYVHFQNFEPHVYHCPYLDSRYGDGGGQNCYGFGCSSFKCKPLTLMIGLNVPNPSSDRHPFFNFGCIIPNPKPP
jgi:hypothetical protein